MNPPKSTRPPGLIIRQCWRQEKLMVVFFEKASSQQNVGGARGGALAEDREKEENYLSTIWDGVVDFGPNTRRC